MRNMKKIKKMKKMEKMRKNNLKSLCKKAGALAAVLALCASAAACTNIPSNAPGQTNSPSPSAPASAAPSATPAPEGSVSYYIDKLSDKSFIKTYNEDYVWYTAAEELGAIGKDAIPPLIQKLDTTDDYERALALYALLLASQNENVKSFTGGEYIEVNLDFDAATHPEAVAKAKAWWEKYKDNF